MNWHGFIDFMAGYLFRIMVVEAIAYFRSKPGAR